MNPHWTRYRYPAMVGFFTLIALGILITIIFTLGGQHGTFMKSMQIKVEFENVNGLKKGDNVWFSGVRVGAIREIMILGKNKVLVTLAVEEGLDSLIRVDSEIRIGSDGVMGNRIIIITPGTTKAPPVTDATILKAEKAADTHRLLQDLTAGGEDLIAVVSNLRSITESIRDGEGIITRLLEDPRLSKDISLSATRIKQTAEEAVKMMAAGKKAGYQITGLLEEANQKGHFINNLISDSLMYSDLSEGIHSLRESSKNLNKISVQLNDLISESKNSGSAASLLLSDPKLGKTLISILTNLDSASRKLDEDLLAAREGFLLRRYFRKKRRNN